MAIETGQQLLHYRLTEQIGEGGMGVVWRATDTTLDRDVAIKLLPDGFAADADRLARFEREAKLLASLNHPHIATIHGLHEADTATGSAHFLVMELVEGDDLSQLIARGALGLEQAIEIATQIAQALEVAHGNGVIHRDLKPANVKLTADGQIKVLDFGLAKALGGDPASGSSSVNPTMSPTLTSAGTMAGTIIGTAAYMSPEQARGRPVDRRADLWAFGCLLYEMLTGQRTFTGETISDTLASVLKEQPDVSALPDETPPAVRRLLRRCLTKDARQRLSDATDARLELQEALEPPHPGESLAAPGFSAEVELAHVPATRRALPWVVAAAAIVIMLASWFMLGSGETVDAELLSLAIPLPAGVKLIDEQSSNLAISRDGSVLVFAGIDDDGKPALYQKKMDSQEIRLLTGTADAENPFFSPDGRWIAFFAEGKLKKMLVGGGTPVTICNAPGSVRGASWGADDLIVFPLGFTGGLSQVPGSGGEVTPLTQLDEVGRERTHRWPQVVPDQQVVLFTVATEDSPEFYDDARIDALRLDTGEQTTVFEGASHARYVPTGHLVFGRDGFLWSVPFDIDALAVTGTPVPVVEGVMGAPTSGAVYASISQTGLLVYVPGAPVDPRSRLVSSTFDGQSEPIAGAPVAGYVDPVFSPDGKRIAVGVSGDGHFDIWVYDIARKTPTRLTFEGTNTEPVWTPDGKSILFNSVRHGKGAAYLKSADGSGEVRLVYEFEGGSASVTSISSDGRWVTLSVHGDNKSDIYVLPLEEEDAEALPVLTGPGDEIAAVFSPDGRWLAYSSDESGEYEVFVRAYPGAGGRWQVSNGGGVKPRWSHDGRRLFYRDARRLLAVDIGTSVGGDAFRAGTPEVLIENLPRTRLRGNYDVAHDDKSILFIEWVDRTGPSDQITVLVNWFEVLR